MEKLIAASAGDRVDIICSEGFRVFATVKGQPGAYVGPPSADLRRTFVTVPEGCDGLLVETKADAYVDFRVTVMPNPKEVPDPTRLIDSASVDRPPSANDLVANLVRRELIKRGLTDDPPETIEEANDFEMDDDDLDWFEAQFVEMAPEAPDQVRADDSEEDGPSEAPTAPQEDEPPPARAEDAASAP